MKTGQKNDYCYFRDKKNTGWGLPSGLPAQKTGVEIFPPQKKGL